MSKTQEKVKKIIAEIENPESVSVVDLQNPTKKLSTNEVIDILLADPTSLTDNKSEKNLSGETGPQFWYDMRELQHWKDQNNNTYSIPYYRPIDTHTRRFPKILNFAKRAVRKLCRSLVEPICIDITNFNSSVTASINALYNNEVVTEAFTNYQLSLNQENDKRFTDLEIDNKEKILNYQKQLNEACLSFQTELSNNKETFLNYQKQLNEACLSLQTELSKLSDFDASQILSDQKFVDQLKEMIDIKTDTVQKELEQQLFTQVLGTLDEMEQRICASEENNTEINGRLNRLEEHLEMLSQKISENCAQIEDIKNSYSNSNKDIYERISQVKDALFETENKFNTALTKDENEFSTALAGAKNTFEIALSGMKNQFSTALTEIENKIDTSLTETEISLLRTIKEKSIANCASEDQHNIVAEKEGTKVLPEDTYSSLDYFKFENYFRGPRAQIKKEQKEYLKYLSGKGHVLDLGCGRGELLELLKDNGIPATGIDAYEEFVEYCQFKELHAQLGKIPACLSPIPAESIGAVFAGQLVEHLSFDELNKMCQEVYRIMIPGGCLIIETPNPTCLSTYLNSFYMDPSHDKPVHPKTLQYLLQQQGFNKIQIIYTEESKVGYRLPLLSAPDAENLSEFNDGINFLSDIIFGSQDYAIIAYK